MFFRSFGAKMRFCGFGGKMHFCVFDGKSAFLAENIFAFLAKNIYAVFAKKCDLTKRCVLWFWRKNVFCGFGGNMQFLRAWWKNAFWRF